jgi:glycosyltransferase involved in cell wall biosynthesis
MSEVQTQNYLGDAVLHIMHSWGGGIERWAQDYCRTDTSRNNIVLKSIGVFGNSGQKLALYNNIDDETPTQMWGMTPFIRSTSITHLEYCIALEEIISDFNVTTIVVSSFIGHSLDILNTGLETIVVCHDYYPFCPALNIYFEKVCSQCKLSHLQSCCTGNKYNRFFSLASATEWFLIRKEFINLILYYQITLVVPSISVKHNLIRLDPIFADVNFVLIEHGIELQASKNMEIGITQNQYFQNKLKILVLGNLQLHKGLELLQQTYSEIVKFADITLLGCGGYGHLFQGLEGIYIESESYTHSDLPQIVEKISPDIGLLLSVVPETFSYTLSELMDLGIPTLATQLGSFEDRILDGVNGFLVEPGKDEVIKKTRYLSDNRDLILQVAERLQKQTSRSLKEMVRDYSKVISSTSVKRLTPEELKQIQDKLQRSQLQLEQSELNRVQNELQILQLDLQTTQFHLEEYINIIKSMETSKFWKLRGVWLQFKNFLSGFSKLIIKK